MKDKLLRYTWRAFWAVYGFALCANVYGGDWMEAVKMVLVVAIGWCLGMAMAAFEYVHNRDAA